MKWSPILHGIAALTGVFGLLAIFAAWITGSSGTFLSLSQEHFYNDATVLLLASIAFGLGTLIHHVQKGR
ncbi:hypothetical protein IID20_02970 [Patescibacteria group bacterium]|nr:hypothetical protein [Patescibacteria group bacterium]